MSIFLDERLSSLKAYVPGEQPKPGEFIKLNTNEFPYPPAPGVAEAAINAVGGMNLYCDMNCTRLKAEFKKVFGYGGENVLFTNGSDEALYLCFLTFCGKNRGAAFADITYGFYSVYADLCGLEKQIIPLDDEFSVVPGDYYNLDKTVFIANPNAPTGKKLSVNEIESIVQSNKGIVVIDEAYTDFSGATCAALTEKYNNLVVVGTFSKSRGMAGARLGYVIADRSLIEDLNKVVFSINPYNVNSLTQAVGTAALENNDYFEKCIAEICETRDTFSKSLSELGFIVIPSQTNFVFVKYKGYSGEAIANALRGNGILIRHFSKERINDFVRISIGTPEQMEKVLSVIKTFIGGKK